MESLTTTKQTTTKVDDSTQQQRLFKFVPRERTHPRPERWIPLPGENHRHETFRRWKLRGAHSLPRVEQKIRRVGGRERNVQENERREIRENRKGYSRKIRRKGGKRMKRRRFRFRFRRRRAAVKVTTPRRRLGTTRTRTRTTTRY